MAKRNKEKEESILKQEQIDILANDVLEIINRKFKEKDLPDAAGYMSNANLVTNWCPTGCDILDLAISNRPYGGQVYRDWETDRKSTRLNSSHSAKSRMPSSA